MKEAYSKGPKPMYPPKKKRSRFLLIALGAALCLNILWGVQEISAVTKTALVRVSAQVIPYVQIKFLSQPSQITLTEEDIERGFMDVSSASRLEVRTNSNLGYMIAFEGNLSPFSAIQIQGLSNPVQMISNYTSVSQPSVKGTTIYTLSYRFILSPNSQPGTYNWPLTVSIQTA
jgi:hypothetical protein